MPTSVGGIPTTFTCDCCIRNLTRWLPLHMGHTIHPGAVQLARSHPLQHQNNMTCQTVLPGLVAYCNILRYWWGWGPPILPVYRHVLQGGTPTREFNKLGFTSAVHDINR